MKPFGKKTIKHVDVKAMNTILAECKKSKNIVYCEKDSVMRDSAFISVGSVSISVTTTIGKPCTYVCRLDADEEIVQQTTGLTAYTALAKAWKKAVGYAIPKVENVYGVSARALLAYRNDYSGKRVHAWGYDMRSAYGWAMKQKMPDTRVQPARNRGVDEGEIGFSICDTPEIEGMTMCCDETIVMRQPGEYADYIFPAIDSPMVDFADRWYTAKETAKTPEAKAKAKAMMLYAIGCLQNHNFWLRAAIVEWLNYRIRQDIDENTISINTDGFITCVERDLDIGPAMGQYKVEHEGECAIVGHTYQWDLQKPKWRGVPKSSIPDGFDILRDVLPVRQNKYEYNKGDCKIHVVHRD